jgi:hypothetical protein
MEYKLHTTDRFQCHVKNDLLGGDEYDERFLSIAYIKFYELAAKKWDWNGYGELREFSLGEVLDVIAAIKLQRENEYLELKRMGVTSQFDKRKALTILYDLQKNLAKVTRIIELTSMD